MTQKKHKNTAFTLDDPLNKIHFGGQKCRKIAQNCKLFFKGLFYIEFYVFSSVIDLPFPLICYEKK